MSAPTPAPLSSTTASSTPQKFWIGLSVVVGAVVLLSWRCRRGRSCSCRSIDGVQSMSYDLLTARDPMGSVAGSDAQDSGEVRMTPIPILASMLPPTATVPHDAQGFDRVEMTRSPPTETVLRHARDLDGVSSSSLQSLLRESAAPAFIGEDSSLVPNPTCTNIQAHSHDSELEPRGDHVERGPR